MATTKYKQTIKGSKELAAAFQRQADLLDRQFKERARSGRGLDLQLRNAYARNSALRKSRQADILLGNKSALEGYDRAETDAISNLGTATEGSRLNRAREASNSMAEVANLGGGLTDRIKAMVPAIRNMAANVGNAVNDYASAVTGLNNSKSDLNTNTRTNLNNELREQNASNAAAFAEWSAGHQQRYADLMDISGQRGSALEEAAMALADKKSSTKSKGTKNVKSTQKDSIDHNDASRAVLKKVDTAFDHSAWASGRLADQMGRTFTSPILTIDQMNAESSNPNMKFTEAAMSQNQSNLDELENAGTLRKLKDAEGSKLRKRAVTV